MLGPVAEARDGLSEDARHAATNVIDLDAPAGSPAVRPEQAAGRPGSPDWPGWTPAWARGPFGVVVAALAAAALVAVVATGLAERREAADRRGVLRLVASLTWPDSLARSGEPVDLRVLVLNAGPEPVVVTDLRLEDSTTQLRLTEARSVDAGAVAALPASLDLDCEGALPGRLLVTALTADGRRHEVAPPGLGRGVGMAPGDVRILCGRQQQLEPVPVWRTWVERDGALALQLRSPRAEPAVLTVASPPGTSLRGEPALPATLPAGRTVLLHLYLEVERCTNAAQRPDAGDQLRFHVDDEAGTVRLDQATVVGWFAQQVQKQCS